MNPHLSSRRCVACEGGTAPLKGAEVINLKSQTPSWNVAADEKSISHEFTFKNFKEALAFVNKVGAIAEEEGHHPDLNLFDYKKVLVTLTTHAIRGLSENDFIIAAKVDHL